MGRKIKHDYVLIYKRHLEGETILKISEDLKIPIQSIYDYFRRKKLPYNPNIPIRRKGYYVDDNYLNNFDTEDKVYFLGWMLSDGYIQGKDISLKLQKKDDYIIEEMFGKFSKGYKMQRKDNFCGMSVSSENLSKKLKDKGCIQNKTEIGFDFPDLQPNLVRHFIRGYFEGDGSIGFRAARPNQRQISICSPDKNFLIQFEKILNTFNIASTITEEIRKGKGLVMPNKELNYNCKNMYRLILTNHIDKLKFYELIYKDCNIKLERKYVLYSEYYANTVLTLEKKNSKAVQRIGDETLINYDLIDKTIFYRGSDLNDNTIIEMYKKGVCEYHIHKQTKICRSVIKRIVKEYNSSTSAQQPIS